LGISLGIKTPKAPSVLDGAFDFSLIIKGFRGAHGQNRTDDLILTKNVLYRLSYMGKGFLN
jgi:hypothetical protein